MTRLDETLLILTILGIVDQSLKDLPPQVGFLLKDYPVLFDMRFGFLGPLSLQILLVLFLFLCV